MQQQQQQLSQSEEAVECHAYAAFKHAWWQQHAQCINEWLIALSLFNCNTCEALTFVTCMGSASSEHTSLHTHSRGNLVVT
jgi:hypothetical protein